MKALHFPAQGMLIEQFRSTVGLNDYSNLMNYGGKLISGPEPQLEHPSRLLSRKLAEFHAQFCGVNGYDMMFNVPYTDSQKESPGVSTWNKKFTYVILWYLKCLLEWCNSNKVALRRVSRSLAPTFTHHGWQLL